jgi:phosphoesterase RecJ-like protein
MIRAAGKIALTCHVHPDGDTLGSALALALAAGKMGKTVHVFCDDPVPQVLRMMQGSDAVMTPDHADASYDLLIAVDTADEKRMGACFGLIERAAATAQVDHHGTNPAYMQENDVDPAASATALLVHELIGTLGVALDRDIATCLYVAIATDTGNLILADHRLVSKGYGKKFLNSMPSKNIKMMTIAQIARDIEEHAGR